MNGPLMTPNQDPNGFIMVDPLHSTNQPQVAGTSKKNKRNKKKNKNNTNTDVTANASSQPKIVTLRNPLFQAGNDPIASAAQPQMRNSMPLNMNQAASIIKNENGMFTIRNTALHQALSNGVGNNFRQYSGEMYAPTEPTQPQHHSQSQGPHQPPQSQPQGQDNFSYFSDGMSGHGSHGAHGGAHSAHGAQQQSSMPTQTAAPAQTCTMAIGSELKNAHMKGMPWNGTVISKQPSSNANGDIFNNMSHLNPQQSRSYSPFDAIPSYGFNSDFIGSSPTPHSQPSTSTYFNNGGGYPSGVGFNQPESSSLFSGNMSMAGGMQHGQHRCDDSSPLHDMSPYYNNGINQSYYKKYEDTPLMHNLQPGHRLNSEVIPNFIHSVL